MQRSDPKRKPVETILYMSESEPEEEEKQEKEPIVSIPPKKTKNLLQCSKNEPSNVSDSIPEPVTDPIESIPYKKNPPGTSRRDLVGKFEKELQCQYCSRPYRQRHHLLAHEAKTCPVVLEMARDALARSVRPKTRAPVRVDIETEDETDEEESESEEEEVVNVKRKTAIKKPPIQKYPITKRRNVTAYDVNGGYESDREPIQQPTPVKPMFRFGGR